jgi:hypothetical protein
MKEICGNPTVRKHISDAKKKEMKTLVQNL